MSCDFEKFFNSINKNETTQNIDFGIAKLTNLNPFSIKFQGKDYTSKGFNFYKIQDKIEENQHGIKIEDYKVGDNIMILSNGYDFYLWRKVEKI